ncbi:MAG: energy-coupling factor transporter ATPase [Clostridia bacterium]|nr:energy-coupling factor transporter ATPase [Clostridia bacterium]
MDAFIRAENLSFSYESGKDAHPALKNLSVEIGAGEYVAVLGHNGSGKSTFAKLLNMILTPTGGKLFVAGEELSSPDFDEEALYRLRARVGMVFQNPDNQIVASVVEEDVAFGLENLGVSYDEMHERVKGALAAVDMTEYARHAPSRLSGGQKQRVAIAGLIAMLPDCMILDEATAMLDPRGRREVLDVVERLRRERGITLIHITHYMDEAARADRVLVIDDGTLLLDGTPHEVFAQADRLAEVGLETPQGTALLHALRKEGLPLPADGITAQECADAILRLWREKNENT